MHVFVFSAGLALIEYNMCRHYGTHHADKYNDKCGEKIVSQFDKIQSVLTQS